MAYCWRATAFKVIWLAVGLTEGLDELFWGTGEDNSRSDADPVRAPDPEDLAELRVVQKCNGEAKPRSLKLPSDQEVEPCEGHAQKCQVSEKDLELSSTEREVERVLGLVGRHLDSIGILKHLPSTNLLLVIQICLNKFFDLRVIFLPWKSKRSHGRLAEAGKRRTQGSHFCGSLQQV